MLFNKIKILEVYYLTRKGNKHAELCADMILNAFIPVPDNYDVRCHYQLVDDMLTLNENVYML